MSQLPSTGGGGPSTPSHITATARFALPTPSGIARRSSLAKADSPMDSPDTAYKKQSLAEAISRNDPARYRGVGAAAAADDQVEGSNTSPLLTADRLQRPGVVGRRSTAGLRRRSETPTGLPAPQGSQLSPPSMPHSRATSVASSADGGGSLLPSPSRSRSPLAPLAGRPSLGGAAASSSSARGYATPKRLSDVHARATAATITPSLPSHAAATIASRARELPFRPARRGKDLEIGDIVTMEGQGLTGVLRFLGAVEGKSGSYAGLELIGDCAGKGKNNGSIQGVQYFACDDGNGVFCIASKVVATNDSPPKDAVARPASAMSGRSSRQSDVYDRPPSTTPGRRRASTVSRPPSTTPSRASSRASVRPPSVTPGSRPASAMSVSRPASRLAARKSLGTMAAVRDDDERDLQRRAKTSAEYAAAAEQRITEGSRAHKLLGMTAKDLQQRRVAGAAGSKVSSRLGGSPVKSTATVGPPASPLKNTRSSAVRTPRSSITGAALASSTMGGGPATPGLPKARQSLGGIPTPRAAKGRVSMFAKPTGNAGTNSMPPTRSPTKDGYMRPASSLSLRSSSRLSHVHSTADDDDDAEGIAGEAALSSGRNSSLDRARDLLEAMDLTPRRPAASKPTRHQQSASFSGYGVAMPDEAFQQNDSVAEAVVPLSLYEGQEAELERLRIQADALEKKNAELTKLQGARKARMSEIRSNEAILEEERARLRAEAREKEKEMEEERQFERQDDLRRRKEIEDRERELKERLDESVKNFVKLQDEHQKAKGDHESQTRDLEANLEESAKLIDGMKKSLEDQAAKEEGETKAALEVQLKVQEAEIESLKGAVRRLEAELKRERKELGDQIDELKDAGRETISLYEQRIQEVEHENHELINNMKLLEQRAQEAIASAEVRYEALAGRSGAGASSAATEIDNENLREQVAHLQDRLGNYEDQIAEATMALEKEKEYLQKKKERSVEVETSLKNEIKRLKAEIERLVASDKEAKGRYEEARAALEESKAAHESERAELEGLRADVENIESLNGGSVRTSSTKDVAEAKKWETERTKLEAEILTLTTRLDGYRRGHSDESLDALPSSTTSRDDRRTSTASSIASSAPDRRSSRTWLNSGLASSDAASSSSANQVSSLNYLVRQLTEENVDVQSQQKMLESELKDKLREAEQKARTLELTVETLERELQARPSAATPRLGADGAAATQLTPQRDLAEKLAECEQRLRDNEAEIVKLRLCVKEVEKSREQEVSGLNKEVAELEALVEARIFREDELEGEIDRLKRKLDKGRNGNGGGSSGVKHGSSSDSPSQQVSAEASRNNNILEAGPRPQASGGTPPTRRRTTSQMEEDSPTANRRASRRLSDAVSSVPTPSTTTTSALKSMDAPNANGDRDEDDEEDFCGLCSKRGHSVVDCAELDKPLLRQASSSQQAHAQGQQQSQAAAGSAGEEPCDDCGELGHRFEDCPYANEIF